MNRSMEISYIICFITVWPVLQRPESCAIVDVPVEKIWWKSLAGSTNGREKVRGRRWFYI